MEEPKIEAIEEIVIAVKDVNQAAARFKELFGMEFEYGWTVPGQKVKVRSQVIDGTQLQFIQATDPESVVAKFIKAKGEGLNHFAFKVKNLKEMVKRLKAKGVRFIPEEVVEIGLKDKKIPIKGEKASFIFIHPSSAFGVLIELVEGE
ncbi:MAG: VOC family protein [Pseudomonadota bacterium]|jgi:methylmalonyl-CoA/ethylmalonyl-CoA epimerase|nr:VOC family protein [Pseudomonadota bacterium]